MSSYPKPEDGGIYIQYKNDHGWFLADIDENYSRHSGIVMEEAMMCLKEENPENEYRLVKAKVSVEWEVLE
jgi:hypothetical protein